MNITGGNKTESGGGAILIPHFGGGGVVSASWCIFFGNRGTIGGAIFANHTASSIVLLNVSFVDNEALYDGGGAFAAKLGRHLISASGLMKNSATHRGGAVLLSGEANLNMSRSTSYE